MSDNNGDDIVISLPDVEPEVPPVDIDIAPPIITVNVEQPESDPEPEPEIVPVAAPVDLSPLMERLDNIEMALATPVEPVVEAIEKEPDEPPMTRKRKFNHHWFGK